ncbi:MAG: chemotaxis protein CheA [Spirochaetaceae bacterium]
MKKQNNSSLYTSFLHDGETYIQNLNSILLRLEKAPDSKELVREAFRNAHSLKSEASYLNETEIAEAAHKMETALEEAGSAPASLDRERFDYLFHSLDSMNEMLSLRKIQREDSFAHPGAEKSGGSLYEERMFEAERNGELQGKGESVSVPETEPETETEIETDRGRGEHFVPDFTDFERELLKEARDRGERFLRISVTLDESTAITYAKGYLILNNLEQVLQVIKTTPPFGAGHERGDDDREYLKAVFYCTADVEDVIIYHAVNVDRVERILISPLSYESVIKEKIGEPEREGEVPDISIKIDGKDVDELNGYVDELKIRIHRLKRQLSGESEQMVVLTQIVRGLEDFVKKLSMVELSEVFKSHFRMVRDLSAKLGKKAELSLEGCEVRVDRRAAEVLSEITVHLIRNALDHGIEMPEERKGAGKNETGSIVIEARKEENKLIVTVNDDGRGIRREELMEKAREQKIRIDEVTGGEDELLRFLVYPGLTTLSDATETSGRGYGLDIVFQKVRQFEGGGLSVFSDEGGASFTVELPAGFSLLTLQIVRCGENLIAVPQQHIREVFTIDREKFSADEKGALLWDSYPVYTLDGRLYYTDVSPGDSCGILIDYLGRRAVVLVDELMFKKEIPEDRLTLYMEGSPYLHRMKISGSTADFLYLSPSIVAM